MCAHVYSIAGICGRIHTSTLDPLHEQIESAAVNSLFFVKLDLGLVPFVVGLFCHGVCP